MIEVLERCCFSIEIIGKKWEKLAIFTEKGRKSIEISLEKLDLKNYFDYIVSDDNCY
ncbi:HAD hydrolase-like protein [Streptococcus gordonii]|uniref:HAD hydrolase-like protein n=1 Tax=Streptococcus gordonii TaxID=1302 RepID=UPI003AAE0046